MKEQIYMLVEFNGENVLPRFSVRETFKTFEEAKDKLNMLNQEAKENGWTRNYILTKSL